MFEGLRWEAAAQPLGALAVLHGAAFGAIEAQESKRAGEQKSRGAELREAAEIPATFEPQLRAPRCGEGAGVRGRLQPEPAHLAAGASAVYEPHWQLVLTATHLPEAALLARLNAKAGKP